MMDPAGRPAYAPWSPVDSYIPHSRPTVDVRDQVVVSRVVGGGFLGPGASAEQLGAVVARRAGREFGTTTLSGTRALVLALRHLTLERGSFVAIPVLACESLVEACEQSGLQALLTAVRDDLTLDVGDIAEDSSAIIAPHAWGRAVDVLSLGALNKPWIEDCATSPACQTEVGPAGAAGTLSIFSLGSTKFATAGLGGVLVGDAEVRHPQELPDLNAGLGLSQWARLDEFRAIRQRIADRFDEAVAMTHATPRSRAAEDCVHRYILRTVGDASEAAARFRSRNIGASASVAPWLDRMLPNPVRRPRDSSWRGHLLSLPIYPSLTALEIERICDAIVALVDP